MRTKHVVWLVSLVSFLSVAEVGCSSEPSSSAPNGTGGTGGGSTTEQVFPPGATEEATNATEATSLVNERILLLFDGLADAMGAMKGDGGLRLLERSLTDNQYKWCDTSGIADPSSKMDFGGLDQDLRDTRAFFRDHVFYPEYVESDDGTTVTYRLEAVGACDGDGDCLTRLTENPLRFAVNVMSDDSLAVSMLVGVERRTPVKIRMSESALGISGSLAELLDSVRLFVDPSDREDLPRVLTGSVDLVLLKNADRKFTASMSLPDALHLEVSPETNKLITVDVGASPTAEVAHLDANTNSIDWKSNYGSIDVGATGTFFCDEVNSKCGDQERFGTFALHLSGLSGSDVLSPNSNEVSVNGYGFGDETSFVTLNDTRLASADLNPNSGRTLNVTFTDVSEGILVSFEPELDLSVAMTLNKLSDSLKVDMPSWLFDEVFDVSLGGDPKSSILIRDGRCVYEGEPTIEDRAMLQSGTLTMAATSLAQPVTVDPGMCVVPVETAVEKPHPFMTLGSGVCQ